VAELLRAGLRRHRQGWLGIAERLGELGALRAELSPAAASETLGVLTSWRTWRTLTVDYGLNWPEASEWMAQTVRPTVLAELAEPAVELHQP